MMKKEFLSEFYDFVPGEAMNMYNRYFVKERYPSRWEERRNKPPEKQNSYRLITLKGDGKTDG